MGEITHRGTEPASRLLTSRSLLQIQGERSSRQLRGKVWSARIVPQELLATNQLKQLNLWLEALKGPIPINTTSATD